MWECEPCKFRFVEDGSAIETCVMGSATITDESTGRSITVTPGSSWTVRPGTVEIWEIYEQFRKEYVGSSMSSLTRSDSGDVACGGGLIAPQRTAGPMCGGLELAGPPATVAVATKENPDVNDRIPSSRTSPSRTTLGALWMALALVASACAGPAATAGPTATAGPAATGSATAAATPANTEPIVVGAIIPLTGAYAADGLYQKRGVELAVADINAAGGINGRQVQLELFDVQDQLPENLKAAADHLLGKKKVDAVFDGYAGYGPSGSEFGAKSDVPFMRGDGSSRMGEMTAAEPDLYWNTFDVYQTEPEYGKRAAEGLLSFGEKYTFPEQEDRRHPRLTSSGTCCTRRASQTSSWRPAGRSCSTRRSRTAPRTGDPS